MVKSLQVCPRDPHGGYSWTCKVTTQNSPGATEYSSSADLLLPKLGHEGHCHSCFVFLCIMFSGGRQLLCWEHSSSPLERLHGARNWGPPAYGQHELASHVREPFWKQSLVPVGALSMTANDFQPSFFPQGMWAYTWAPMDTHTRVHTCTQVLSLSAPPNTEKPGSWPILRLGCSSDPPFCSSSWPSLCNSFLIQLSAIHHLDSGSLIRWSWNEWGRIPCWLHKGYTV